MNPSLLLIPDRYKKDKLYSQIPESGDGDLTFARNSNATRVNSAGLIEKVRTNANINFQAWNKLNGSEVLTSGVTDPFGGTNAFNLSGIVAGNFNYGLSIGTVLSVGASSYFTVSLYAKGTGTIAITAQGTGFFTPLNITLTSTWTRYSLTIQPSGAISSFVFYVSNYTGSTATSVDIAFPQAELGDIATDYIPTTTAAVSVGITADIPRLDYTGGGCPSLLLEPQTTALNQFSESFDNSYWVLKTDVTISANTTDTLDPSGYYGADKITETATTARHRVASDAATLTAVNNTASVFMKKGTARYGFVTFSAATIFTIVVDLEDGTITSTSTTGTIVAQKVENYGNGWYRISVTGLSAASGSSQYSLQFGSAGSATPSYTANIPSFAGSTSNHLYAWGANLTATSYLQSYIPTLSTSVTRVLDSFVKTGISSLINSQEGTLFFELAADSINTGTSVLSLSDGTSSNTLYAGFSSTNNSYVSQLIVGGVAQNNFAGTLTNIQANNKFAISYKANDIKMYINGTLVASNTSATMPAAGTFTKFASDLGQNSFKLYGRLSQALIFPTALTATQLAELTA
jgi:hypothetical protein